MKKLLFMLICLVSNQILAGTAHKLPLFTSTIPKSGTHLLDKLIFSIVGRKGGWPNEAWTIAQDEVARYTRAGNLYYLTHAPYIGTNGEIIKRNKVKGTSHHRIGVKANVSHPRDYQDINGLGGRYG